MSSMLYDKLASHLAKAARDPAFRIQLLKDPTGTIKAEGTDIGKAKIKMDWVENTNSLNVLVENGGANWHGAILLDIRK
jgi:hypothetical protein